MLVAETKFFRPVGFVIESKDEAQTIVYALLAMAGDVKDSEKKNRIEKMAMQISHEAGL